MVRYYNTYCWAMELAATVWRGGPASCWLLAMQRQQQQQQQQQQKPGIIGHGCDGPSASIINTLGLGDATAAAAAVAKGSPSLSTVIMMRPAGGLPRSYWGHGNRGDL